MTDDVNRIALRPIGYWRSEREPEWPDPGAFVDASWQAETRAAVVAHLRNGTMVCAAAGLSWCRFRCMQFGARGLGSTELSDGRFIWPEGLVHYVEQHLVRLPDEFVHSASLPPGPVPQCFEELSIEASWWSSESGFGGVAKTYLTPAPQGNLYALTTGVRPSPELMKEVRRCAATHAQSLAQISAIFERGARLLLLSGIREAEVVELRRTLAALGLPTIFVVV